MIIKNENSQGFALGCFGDCTILHEWWNNYCVFSIATDVSLAQFRFFFKFYIIFLKILCHYDPLIAFGLIVSFSKVKKTLKKIKRKTLQNVNNKWAKPENWNWYCLISGHTLSFSLKLLIFSTKNGTVSGFITASKENITCNFSSIRIKYITFYTLPWDTLYYVL